MPDRRGRGDPHAIEVILPASGKESADHAQCRDSDELRRNDRRICRLVEITEVTVDDISDDGDKEHRISLSTNDGKRRKLFEIRGRNETVKVASQLRSVNGSATDACAHGGIAASRSGSSTRSTSNPTTSVLAPPRSSAPRYTSRRDERPSTPSSARSSVS